MNNNLIVKSKYLTSESYVFYVINFKQIINHTYLAHNYNKYNLIIFEETYEDLLRLKNTLNAYKKNPEFNINNLTIICSNNIQINWCKELNFNYKQMSEIEINNIFDQQYIPQIVEMPEWAFQHHVLGMEYYVDDNIQIIHLEGLDHSWNILPYLTNNKYVFVTWPCYFHKWLYEYSTNTMFTLNPTFNKKNIIFLAPDLDCILWAHEYGFSSILCNHNSLLDYNKLFYSDKEIIYSMVMNCRPELRKQPYLAENVIDLAYIKGATYGNTAYDYTKLKCKFMNENIIPIEEVINIYNQSYCGGIFSKREGACYSSSEYLLCGLPVISVNSRGGRDTWYTPTNSIIIEEDTDIEITKNKVVEAIEQCKYNIENNIFNREKIRNDHIIMSDKMRQNFINYTQEIFNKHNIQINAEEHWNGTYFHKLQYKVKTNEFIEILS
jgi:hypothetical protein